MTLQPIEFISLLLVLSILHISLSSYNFNWLSGNVDSLAKFNFGALDMRLFVDLLEDAMKKIAHNGDLKLQEELMMISFVHFRKRLNDLMSI